MDSELTGRKVKVTEELRQIAEEGLARIEKIVGNGATAHIIFSSEKHAAVAEVTVNARRHTVIGLAEAPDLAIALRTALEKTEKQAIRWKKSKIEKKRQSKPISAALPLAPIGDGPQSTDQDMGRHATENGKSSANAKSSGLHIVSAPESMAQGPMTIEEAVKEAESKDQTVFVFRDLAGDVKVLHCTGEGFVRLIEVS